MSKKHKMVTNMSAEELKMKLYDHFNKKGSMDKFRAQLRNELVSELFKVAEPRELESQNAQADDNRLLPLQVSNWLVYDHLQRQGYDYTLSTFVSESKLSYPEKFLTIYDILDLLGFKSHTAEYKHFSAIYFKNHKQAFLYSLLSTLMKSFFNHEEKSKEIISDKIDHKEEIEDAVENLSKRNKSIFNAFHHSRNVTSFTNNERLADKDVYYQQQLQTFKEKNERDVQTLKEKLIEELDNLHSREKKIHVDLEQAKSHLAREKKQLSYEQKKIKEKQSVLENDFEKEIEAKLKAAEDYISVQLQSKEKELENWEQNIKAKEQKFLEERNRHDIFQQDNENLKGDLKNQIEINKNVQSKYSSILDENTSLLKKFESMSDYSVIKSENISKSSEILNLKHEIKNIQQKAEFEKEQLKEKIRTLQKMLEEKDPKLIRTEEELSLIKRNFNDEHLRWDHQREQLEQEVAMSQRLYETVIQRLEEQKEDIQDLHRTIHILHYQMMNKESSSADENAERARPLRSGITSAEPKTFYPSSSSAQTSRFISKRPPRRLLMDRNADAFKFISDAKKRIVELQHEADGVKQKYSLLFSSSALTNTSTTFQDLPFRTGRSGTNSGGFDSNYPGNLYGSVRPRNTGSDLIGKRNEVSELGVQNLKGVPHLESHALVSSYGVSSNMFSGSLFAKPSIPIASFSGSGLNNVKSDFVENEILLGKDRNAYAPNKLIFSRDRDNLSHNSLPNQLRIATGVTRTAETIDSRCGDDKTEPNLPINHVQDGELNEKGDCLSETPKIKKIREEKCSKNVSEADEPSNAISEVKDSENSVPSRNLNFNDVVEVMPLTIDLDAAWKQKTTSSQNPTFVDQELISLSDLAAERKQIESVSKEKGSFAGNKSSELENVVNKNEGFNTAIVCDVSNSSNITSLDKNNTEEKALKNKIYEQDAMLVKCLSTEKPVIHQIPCIDVVRQCDDLESNTIQKSSHVNESDVVQKDNIGIVNQSDDLASNTIQKFSSANEPDLVQRNDIEVKLDHSLPSRLGQIEERTDHDDTNVLDETDVINLNDKIDDIEASQCNTGEIEKNKKSSPGRAAENDDSVSELSEIKLSCGSDQEQKEDSDFW